LENSPPTDFKLSLAANFAGNGWSALMQLVCIPLYIKFMGIEAYGLIGFYIMLQALLQVLDLGVSPTINREMARYSVQPEKMDEARDLVRTLEVGYWVTGLLIGVVIVFASSWLSIHWIRSSSLPGQTVTRALMLMGILSVFQWPVSFYQGGLMGLHRQVLYNIIRIVSVTLSSGGAVLILWLVAPTITALLKWQIAVNALQSLTLIAALWTCLHPAGRTAKFDVAALRNIWRFAAGMSGIALVSLVLTQIDKVLVSKLLTLKNFGYYSLAWTVANGLLLIAAAVFTVIFPRMSAQVAAGNESGLRHSYHAGSQLMAVLIFPVAAILSVFSYDVLRLWTRSSETASYVAPILSILVLGSALNGLLYLPYALQLAFGWTKLSLVAGVFSVALVVLAIGPLTRRFGSVGAATVWAGLNVLNLLVAVPIMHRRLLRHETWQYFTNLGLPLVVAFGVAIIGRFAFSSSNSVALTLFAVSAVWAGAVLLAVLVSPDIKSWSAAQLAQLRLQYARRTGSLS
jgi:O-antigen/teichoic acid export membrane protein